jgi:hypothetical protein
MTSELRHYIEVSDILGMEYNCSCGARLFHSFSAGVTKIPVACTNCQGTLAPLGSDVDALKKLIDALRDVRGRATALKMIRLQIRE